MKTDKQIFGIFAAFPQWIFELTGLPWPGPCQLLSVSLKAIEQTADGVVYPDSVIEPLTVIEFQFQLDPTIYARIVIEMALVQQSNAMRDVQGVIFFFDEKLDPKTDPWRQVVHAFYLDELINGLAQREPDHPLVAVFRPVLLESEERLEKEARQYYNQIKSSDLPKPSVSLLLDIFVNWIEQRFDKKGKQEIEEMLIGALPDLRETQSGKDLIQIGRVEGKIEGKEQGKIEGKIEGLLLVLTSRFGEVPPELKEQIRQFSAGDKIDQAILQAVKIDSINELTL